MVVRVDIREKGSVDRIASALREGALVVLPTDTLYGMSTPLSSRTGFDRVITLKGRGTDRRFIYLASAIEMVEDFVRGWGCTSAAALDAVWPANLTAILPAGPKAPDWVSGTVAFRVPAAPVLLQIVAKLGEPILSTSVNRTDEPPLTHVDAIEKQFGSEIDMLVTGDVSSGARASTIVDFTGEQPRVLRRGGYDWPATAKPSN